MASIPLEADEGGYAYIAQRWLQGDIPYRDSFDKKPPGVFVIYALIERAIGTSAAAIHWSLQVYTLGTLAVIFALGRRLSSATGALAAAAFAAFMTIDPSVDGNAANTELFMILPLTAAMLASVYAVERQSLAGAFAAGLLGGLGLIIKQTALSNAIFYVVFVIWGLQRRWLAALTVLLGVLTVPALVGFYFSLHGAMAALIDATIWHSWAYANRIPAARYAEMSWLMLPSISRAFWPLLLLAAVPIVGFARMGTDSTQQRNTIWVLLWLAASFFGVVTGGYFRLHYFVQLIPPITILAGMAVSMVSRRLLCGHFRRAVAVGLVAVPIAIGLLSSPWYYFSTDTAAKVSAVYGTSLYNYSLALGGFIAEHSHADDTVFVLGSEPQILYYAARKSATRYIFVHPLTGPFPDARERQYEALSEVLQNRPRLVVTVFLPGSFAGAPGIPMDIFDGTREMLNDAYRVIAVLMGTPSGVTLLIGDQAEAAWQASPVWYGGLSWCALAVWERVSGRP